MKFALLISTVVAINIGNLPEETITVNCEGIGEDKVPSITAKCSTIATNDVWSVTEWKSVRHKTDSGCSTNCCYKVTEGSDAALGSKSANCV